MQLMTPENLELYEQALTEWFALLSEQARAAGVRLIIMYHPHLIPQMDGSFASDTIEPCLAAFRSACEKTGVIFLDLTEAFMRAAEDEHRLPHGFANTAMGIGHLNPTGHRIAAEELCRVILEEEAAVQ